MGLTAPVTLHAHTMLTPQRLLSPGWLTVDGSIVTDVGAGHPPTRHRVVRLGGHLLVPGFVDLHVHGGGGAQVNGVTTPDLLDADSVEAAAPAGVAAVARSVRRLAAHHARHGTTALLATVVTCPPAELLDAVRGIAACMGVSVAGARVLGANLEGPWLASSRAGAHEVRQLRPPDVAELIGVLAASPGAVRVVTIAPELAGATTLVRELVEHGIVVSVGHTDADYATTNDAIAAGATHVTHLFNAMAGLHHRDPGPIGAALADERVTVEIIADGVHVHPAVVGIVIRAARGRLVAVTDAIAASDAVHVSGGRVTLAGAPDTLAGSLLTMDVAVANLVRAGASVQEAVTAATATPAGVIGAGSAGTIAVGAAADLAILDPDLTCAATVIGGCVVHDPGDLLQGALPAAAG